MIIHQTNVKFIYEWHTVPDRDRIDCLTTVYRSHFFWRGSNSFTCLSAMLAFFVYCLCGHFPDISSHRRPSNDKSSLAKKRRFAIFFFSLRPMKFRSVRFALLNVDRQHATSVFKNVFFFLFIFLLYNFGLTHFMVFGRSLAIFGACDFFLTSFAALFFDCRFQMSNGTQLISSLAQSEWNQIFDKDHSLSDWSIQLHIKSIRNLICDLILVIMTLSGTRQFSNAHLSEQLHRTM